jgi:hypothetical protein
MLTYLDWPAVAAFMNVSCTSGNAALLNLAAISCSTEILHNTALRNSNLQICFPYEFINISGRIMRQFTELNHKLML